MQMTRRDALRGLLTLGLVAPSSALWAPAQRAAAQGWPPVWFWDNTIKAGLKRDAVGLWLFETGSNLGQDTSGQANNLTNNNSVSQVAGKLGQAAQCVAASSQSLSHADNASLSLGGNTPFTIAGWIQFTTLPGGDFPPLVAKDDGGTTSEYAVYYIVDLPRAFFFTVSSNGTAFTSVNATPPSPAVTGTWYFVRAWYDGVNINLRVNEGPTGSTAFSTGVFDGTSAFYIGRFVRTGKYLNGLVDQVGLWRRVLTAAEAAWLYNGGAGRSLA